MSTEYGSISSRLQAEPLDKEITLFLRGGQTVSGTLEVVDQDVVLIRLAKPDIQAFFGIHDVAGFARGAVA